MIDIRKEPAVAIAGSTIAGLLVGAVVASVADASKSHPVLKGSLTGGAIYFGLATLAAFAVYEPPQNPNSLSGPPQPLRFP